MRTSQILLVLGALLGSSPSPAQNVSTGAEGAQRRPNVVFICTDDQARWALGLYGNPDLKTPNLDRIGREGAVFLNAFVITPVCSPSRATTMTSRYPTRFGIDDWINPNTEPDLGLAPAALLWPEVLRAAGYRNMLVGKWHLGTRDDFHPTRQGFDRFFGFRDGGNVPINPTLEVEGQRQKLEGSLPDLLVDQAIKFVEGEKNGPFLLSLHFREPHAPYAPTPEIDSAPFQGASLKIPDVEGLPKDRVTRLTREYYASVHSVDRNVGRLLDALDRLNLSENTLVVFTSDHGYMIGHHGLWHKGNGSWLVEGKSGPRPNMFDDSIRVPLLMRWPGHIRAGTRIERVVTNLDHFPTIVEAVGIGVAPNLRVEGRSLLPLVLGQELPQPWDETVFGQYDMHHTKVARMRMIRTPDWKLIRHLEQGGEDELYDLKSDPGETRNLAGSPVHKDQFNALNRELKRRMMAIGDRLAEMIQ